MEQIKLGNPAVVGLAGFGMTTFLLQLHNLGYMGIGPVLWIGLFYGGLAQFIAGFLEFKVGNNFGFSAFVSYGAFWMALAAFLIFGTSPELVKSYPLLKLTTPEVGYFLLAWTIYTFIMFIASMKHNGALAIVFLTLVLGFAGLTVKELAGNEFIGTLAAWDLMLCAASAWYLMAHVIFADVGINLPVGKAWL